MARTTALSKAEVFTAIEGLLAAGEYPTAARLRERLDRRGSPVVLQRFLSEWYTEHGADFAHKIERRRQVDGDGTIRAQLASATRDALAKFDAQQATRVAELDARAAALDHREAGLLEHERRLDEREIGQRELIDTLKADRQGAITAQQAALDAATRLQADLDTERQRTSAILAKCEDLEHQLDRLQEDLRQATAAGAEQQALVAATQAQLVALQHEQAATLSSLAVAQQDLRELHAGAQRERIDAQARLDAAAEALRLQQGEQQAQAIDHARLAAQLQLAVQQRDDGAERERALHQALDKAGKALEDSASRHYESILAMGRLEGALAQLQREREAEAAALQDDLRRAIQQLQGGVPQQGALTSK